MTLETVPFSTLGCTVKVCFVRPILCTIQHELGRFVQVCLMLASMSLELAN